MKQALTEERFVKDVLGEHFSALGLHLEPTLLITKRVRSGSSFRGGVTSFGKFENDIRRLLSPSGRHLVTTMIDFNGLPVDFPGVDVTPAGSPHQRAEFIEKSVASHFGNRRDLLPYLPIPPRVRGTAFLLEGRASLRNLTFLNLN